MKFCNQKFYNTEFIDKCFIDQLELCLQCCNLTKASKNKIRDTEQKISTLCSLYIRIYETNHDNIYHKNLVYTYMYDVLCDYAEEYDKRNGACKNAQCSY